jgi:stage V sporulation protein SpoVS
MGLLDELKQQADAIKTGQTDEMRLQAKRETYYRTVMLPKLEYIYGWLFELCEHLNLIKPDIIAHYTLGTNEELPPLWQENYRVSVDSRENMAKLVMAFECRADGSITHVVEGRHNIEKTVAYLVAARLHFDRHDVYAHGNEPPRAEFHIELRIPVSVTFQANIEQSCIELDIYNVDRFGLYHTVYKAEAIDEAFMDNLGRYLLRQQPDFHQLDISDEERAAIREQLRAEQERQSRELREQAQREAGQAPAEPHRPRLLDSLKQITRRK